VILQPLVGNGLLTSDGEFWLMQRRLSQPAFHRQRIDGFAETMTAATVRMLDEWAARAGREETLDMSEHMMRLTLEIVGRTLFSMDLTGASETVGKAFSRVNHQMTELTIDPLALAKLRLSFLPSMRRLRGDIQILDDVVNQVIRERRRSGGPDNDLLGMLMAARDESSGAMMDDKQLRDEVMTIMLAGHETTAVALSWAMYLLARHPEVARRLESEIDEVLAGRVPTTADLPALIYNRMVIDETLRLYPPAYTIARWGHEPDRVGPFDLPANSSILLLTYVTHRHPDFWEAPDRFDPERFAPGQGADRPRFAYLPFGGGPRQCIGNSFALVEAQLLLALIVQRFRWTLPAGYRAELEPLITLRPKGGLPVRLEARG
jgi:cytochrome P450